ncbi:MAG: LysR family transcriptional regulator, partial [Roseibium sp.]
RMDGLNAGNIGARVCSTTFEQFRTFLWVARLGGVRRASEQMHLSQPAVSGRLRALEDGLKVQLFDRSPRGVMLTRQGETLKGYVEQLFQVQEQIHNRFANPDTTAGVIKIGVSETIAQSWMPRFLQRISQDYPQLSLELTVDISLNLREDLLSRKLDLAFLMGPISEYRIENIALPEFEMKWYRAAGTGPVDLTRTPVISFARNTRPHRELMAELSGRHGPGVRVYSSSSLSTSLQMIAAGIGVGPYPCTLTEASLEAGRIEEFDPGWQPKPLAFTASYLGDGENILAERCAAIALGIAQAEGPPVREEEPGNIDWPPPQALAEA